MKKLLIAWVILSGSKVFAATASPVSISAVSRASNIVTVTCSAACGIVPNQGFSISGVTDTTFNVNGTAVTGSGTSFTFNQTGSNSSSSGGSVLPAKQVIVLQTIPSPNFIGVQALCWNTTISGLPTSLNSSWPGASTAENNAIKAGATIESSLNPAPYPSTYSKAQIQSDLQARCSAMQSTLSSGVAPAAFYGGFYDGTGWSF